MNCVRATCVCDINYNTNVYVNIISVALALLNTKQSIMMLLKKIENQLSLHPNKVILLFLTSHILSNYVIFITR